MDDDSFVFSSSSYNFQRLTGKSTICDSSLQIKSRYKFSNIHFL
ncbi:hypothetical protein LEP1GSC096_2038 [Leptospira interrogans serovar Hebdomadis str. R499]|uniref:Uncharacterized protein n=1 Tax=Leptospira interrogans serovar Zanoni str. LT2156 TaxID=1001601 RepID=M6HH52_LEPIR|nr:hypothetical protein LEP1GSC087_2231 [Leptospira interrogans serovar Bataviae str. L1111]EKR33887.1 hypothetical protein LEP1GSC096_2038 [Leptospira interrogans serovar Hebdomadis str. R499]EMM94219.1 hypothetical protein LEP1GSC158_0134 [Leptospira interrogans serovar Zanoni str. LT2156]